MEDSSSRPIQSDESSPRSTSVRAKMSMLATATPSPHPAFNGQRPWEGSRCVDYSLRPRADNEKIALPSIRQTFPELQLQPQPQPHDIAVQHGAPSGASPPGPGFGVTSPKYVHSPSASKRRRLSIEEIQEADRARQVPRIYYSPDHTPTRQLSPNIPQRPAGPDTWPAPARNSPYLPNGGPVAHVEVKDRPEARQALPSLPPPRVLERDPAPAHQGPGRIEGYRNSQGPSMGEPHPASYRETNYSYPYHHPTRYQSLSAGSAQSFDRTPFTTGGYGAPYHQDFVRFGEMGPSGLGADNKQRKRRGNLPKETTDKLRAWFVAHLQHPYPTEDEKQELMRQTGLQMNQISNWFINARRRQLPTMINNARAESDAMTGARSGDMKVLTTTERGDFDHGKRETAGPLSDGDGVPYDEDLESLKQHRATNMSRGSV